MRRSTVAKIILATSATLGVAAIASAQSVPAKTGEPPPKGMSTKSPTPGDTGATLEELEGLHGVPAAKGLPEDDPGSLYPKDNEQSEGGDETSEDPEVSGNQGSLPPPELPTTPRVLRYKMTRPIEYVVRGNHRLAVQGRDDLEQRYVSSNVVRYTPLSSDDELPPRAWAMSLDDAAVDAKPLARGETRVLMRVLKSYSSFELPNMLNAPERSHQILRQATLSYRMDDRGKIDDVRVHAPTHPLARGSIEQFARLAATTQPVFPTRPVGPGDTWEQNAVYRDADGLAQYSEDTVNTYTLERWRPCRNSVCALIKVEQEMKSAGRMLYNKQETRGATLGQGTGLLLFDYRRGEIVRSTWKLRGRGSVTALEKKGEGDDAEIKELADADVLVEIEVAADRVDPPEGLPPLPPEEEEAAPSAPAGASKPTASP